MVSSVPGRNLYHLGANMLFGKHDITKLKPIKKKKSDEDDGDEEVLVSDIAYYTQSLPNPPPGSVWKQDEKGDWLLVQEAVPVDETEAEELQKYPRNENGDSIIEHEVTPSDTLSGLCLKYGVSAVEIRRANHISGNHIQHLRKMKIVIKSGKKVPATVFTQENKEINVLVLFKKITGEGDVEAKIYLSDAGYDLNKAVAAWKADTQWHESTSSSSSSCSSNDGHSAPPPPTSATATDVVEVVGPAAVIGDARGESSGRAPEVELGHIRSAVAVSATEGDEQQRAVGGSVTENVMCSSAAVVSTADSSDDAAVAVAVHEVVAPNAVAIPEDTVDSNRPTASEVDS